MVMGQSTYEHLEAMNFLVYRLGSSHRTIDKLGG